MTDDPVRPERGPGGAESKDALPGDSRGVTVLPRATLAIAARGGLAAVVAFAVLGPLGAAIVAAALVFVGPILGLPLAVMGVGIVAAGPLAAFTTAAQGVRPSITDSIRRGLVRSPAVSLVFFAEVLVLAVPFVLCFAPVEIAMRTPGARTGLAVACGLGVALVHARLGVLPQALGVALDEDSMRAIYDAAGVAARGRLGVLFAASLGTFAPLVVARPSQAGLAFLRESLNTTAVRELEVAGQAAGLAAVLLLNGLFSAAACAVCHGFDPPCADEDDA